MRTLSFLVVILLLAGCTAQSADQPPTSDAGPEARLGDGSVATYAAYTADGTPAAVGVRISSQAMASLPMTMSDAHHCYDRDGNGSIEQDAECIMTHERIIPLPSSASARADVPFKWVLFNWNPMGHHPPGIYDAPHFDIHFMIEPIENILAIESGPCGPEFVRCDHFELARKDVPADYLAADYQNFDAIVPAMGNHLIDVTSPELHGTPFTRTWMYGAYDGRITFYEEMVTKAYLESRPDTCFAIKTPKAVEVAGYYPTQSCTRYEEDQDAYTVSMETFVRREATPRAPATGADEPIAANR